VRNRAAISMLRTEIKRFKAAVATADAEKASQEMKVLGKHLDMLVTKGIIHKNQAARRKSRIAAQLKAVKSAQAAKSAKS
jgi:small subunit ribosomal protein S20